MTHVIECVDDDHAVDLAAVLRGEYHYRNVRVENATVYADRFAVDETSDTLITYAIAYGYAAKPAGPVQLGPFEEDKPDPSQPMTMGHVRAWVAARSHIPDDYHVDASLVEFPRSWARGNPFYTNVLLNLHTPDPAELI
jgi:hypothetical protein